MKNEKPRLTDQDYKFVFERVVRLCLDFVIMKNNQVLLIKRDIEPMKGYWCLPGGMIRQKESIDEAAERILKNELGLKLLSKKVIGYIEFPSEINKDGVHVHSVSIAFLTTLEEGELKGGDQAHEIEFFKSLPEKIDPRQGKLLKDDWEKLIV